MLARFLWIVCLLAVPAAGLPAVHRAALDIPPRLQWNANDGYCGEVSLISAGLYFGQYCSQYEARALASPGLPQADSDSQLLLGVNAKRAARSMQLEAGEWDTGKQKTTAQFLVWVKAQVLLGHPVLIGLFMNHYRFSGDRNRKAGDPDYDHIVPVTGIESLQPFSKFPGRYLPADTILFSDNGLWAPAGDPPFDFRSKFGQFSRSRSMANAPSGPIYSLNNNRRNYGLAITGVSDLQGDTIPVRVSTSVDDEVPEIQDGSSVPPAPAPLTLTATVQIPDQTVAYNLYLYSDFASVPDSKFNANAAKASQVWKIPAGSGATFSVDVEILSDEVAAFRAVRESAP